MSDEAVLYAIPGSHAAPRVEEAERWKDEVLQQWARRMIVEAGRRDRDDRQRMPEMCDRVDAGMPREC